MGESRTAHPYGRRALFAVFFACFWASSLIVRQSTGDVSLFTHSVSRLAEIIACLVFAGVVWVRGMSHEGLAHASLGLLAAYCLLELYRSTCPPDVSVVLVWAVGALAGTVNGVLIACLTFAVLILLGRDSSGAAAVLIPLSLALAHVIFLTTGNISGVSAAWIKALLLAIATLGLVAMMRQGFATSMNDAAHGEPALVPSVAAGQGISPEVPATASFVPMGDAQPKERGLAHIKSELRSSVLACDPSMASLFFGAIVFPFFYGLMAQVCDAAGVSSGLFDMATELVGIGILALLALGAGLWRDRFDAEGLFLAILPIFDTALLFLPVFWESEVFASGFIMKCGFLVYTALMLTVVQRLASMGWRLYLFVGGIVLAFFHGTLLAGRLVAMAVSRSFELSFSVVALAALAAVWVLSMAMLVVVTMRRRRGGISDKADPNPDDEHRAFMVFAEAVGLSEREQMVCWEYARGRTIEHIATSLQVSQETVKTHLKRSYAKSDCHSRQDLIDAIEARRDHA